MTEELKTIALFMAKGDAFKALSDSQIAALLTTKGAYTTDQPVNDMIDGTLARASRMGGILNLLTNDENFLHHSPKDCKKLLMLLQSEAAIFVQGANDYLDRFGNAWPKGRDATG